MKVKMMFLFFQILAISALIPGSAGAPTWPFIEENVALRGKATQSQVYVEDNMPGRNHASNAIDGNRDPIHSHGSCTHTSNNGNPWWRVDLLKTYSIHSVTITNRGDGGQGRINGAQIHIGTSLENNGISNPQCAVIESMGSGETKTFNCPQLMKGRYVTVYIPRAEYLTLCEVEVNAYFIAAN